jgi:1-acyl-sn-glycerol-3-phosphate acyltransferase
MHAGELLCRVHGVVEHACAFVPVDRDGGGAAGLRAILDRLLAGGAIILFPEGTRTKDGKLQPARSGIGLTVIKSKAPVVPVRVFGTYEAYSRHIKFPRPHRVAVKYGKPMQFEQLRAEAKVCSKPRLKEIYQQVANELMAAIAKLEPWEERDTFP